MEVLTQVYKETYNDLSNDFLKLILQRSVSIISDNIIFSEYDKFTLNENKLFYSKSSTDLMFVTDKRMTVHNISLLFKKKDKMTFNSDYEIIDNAKHKKKRLKFLIINKLFNLFKKKIFFDFANLKLYLGFLKKKQSPQFLIKEDFFFKANSKFDANLRKKLFEKSKNIYQNKMKRFKYISLDDLFIIFTLMPINLVENFLELHLSVQKRENKNIKRIVMSQMMNPDEINFWVANQKLKFKSNIEVVQHGAGHGFFYYDSHTDYEVSISDKFYTWSNVKLISKNIKNVKQISPLKTIKKNKIFDNDVFIISSDWQYFSRFASAPTATMIEKNWSEQVKFVKNLNFTDKIKLKTSHYYYDDDEKKKFHYSELKKYMTNDNIYKLIENSKILVCSYIGTPFFELMSNDIPFLTFSRMSENIFSVDAKIYLKKLKAFGFLHHSGKSASDYINNNYENILNNWNDKAFIEFRNEFRENFCLNPKNWQKKIFD